jgi:cell division protein FtsL
MVTQFHKKRNNTIRSKLFFHLGGIALALILIGLVVANVKIYQKKQEFLSQVSNLKKQIVDLKSSNANLQQGMSKTNDSQYIEKVAREELDLQKQGETAVSFIMPPVATPEANAVKSTPLQVWMGNISNAFSWLKSKL